MKISFASSFVIFGEAIRKFKMTDLAHVLFLVNSLMLDSVKARMAESGPGTVGRLFCVDRKPALV